MNLHQTLSLLDEYVTDDCPPSFTEETKGEEDLDVNNNNKSDSLTEQTDIQTTCTYIV